MDSKTTKVTVLDPTKKLLKSSGHVLSTEKPLAEYESILLKKAERGLRAVTSDVRGLMCEMLGHEWLRLQGASIIFWRELVGEVEVDLFVRMPEGFLAVVEVKSVHGGLWAEGRIKPSQVKRLHWAAFRLSGIHREMVRVLGLFVESPERMDLFEIG